MTPRPAREGPTLAAAPDAGCMVFSGAGGAGGGFGAARADAVKLFAHLGVDFAAARDLEDAHHSLGVVHRIEDAELAPTDAEALRPGELAGAGGPGLDL